MQLARRIMVVDDDPIVLESVRDMLESAGYEVRTREHALGTSVSVMQWKPDLLLLDIEMPALSGQDLAALFGEHRQLRVPVIFYTSRSPESLRDAVYRSGALGVIPKTADRRRFLQQLESLMAGRGL